MVVPRPVGQGGVEGVAIGLDREEPQGEVEFPDRHLDGDIRHGSRLLQLVARNGLQDGSRLRVGAGEQLTHGAVARAPQSGEKLVANDHAAAEGAIESDERVQLRRATHESEDRGFVVGEGRAERIDVDVGDLVDDGAPNAVDEVSAAGDDEVEPTVGAPLKGDSVVVHRVCAGDEGAQAPGDDGALICSRQGDDVLRVADDHTLGHHAGQGAAVVLQGDEEPLLGRSVRIRQRTQYGVPLLGVAHVEKHPFARPQSQYLRLHLWISAFFGEVIHNFVARRGLPIGRGGRAVRGGGSKTGRAVCGCGSGSVGRLRKVVLAYHWGPIAVSSARSVASFRRFTAGRGGGGA